MTTAGVYSFTSLSSGTTYSTTTGGEYNVFLQLQTVLGNYNIIDTDFNSLTTGITQVGNDLTTHTTDNIKHISSTERASWNSIIDSVSSLEYDMYQIYLYNLYADLYPLKKGLFFDGFRNKNFIDTSNTTTLIDLVGYRACGVADAFVTVPFVNSNAKNIGYDSASTKVGQTFTISDTLKVASIGANIAKIGAPADNIICSLYNTSAGIPTTLIASSTAIVGSTLPTSGFISTVTTFVFANTDLTPGTYAIAFSRSGSLDTVNYYQTVDGTTSTVGASYFYNGTSWVVIATYCIPFNLNCIASVQNIILQSTEQTLSQNFGNAVLYVKSKTTSGCSVSAQISIHSTTPSFNTMTLSSTRDLGGGYQEDAFAYTTVAPANKAIIKLTLNRPLITTAFEVDQYGCILGVN